MEPPTNVTNSATGDLADLTIGELLKRLKPAQLYALLTALVTIISAACIGAWNAKAYFVSTDNHPQVDAISATKEGNAYQQEIRKRPAVRAFEGFLDAAATERWADAFAFTSNAWRSQHKTQRAEDLAREFRMTHRHEFHYYIPREINSDTEVYDIDFEFWDFIPSLPVRESLARSRIADVLKPEKVKDLARELLSELPRDYRTTGRSQSELEKYVEQFTSNLTLRDGIIRDDLIEVLGSEDHLKLDPIVITETYQGKPPPIEKRRFVRATLVRETGQWRVHSYDSFMVEKR